MSKFTAEAREWPGLTKLIEEAGEVVQVCGKLMQTDGALVHYDGTDLKEALEDEIADVLAACLFVMDYSKVDREKIMRRRIEKYRRFTQWRLEQMNDEPEASDG